MTICRQGRPEDGQLARLGPGEFFGELGLIDDSIRTAQARAATDCRLLVLFRDDLQRLDGQPFVSRACSNSPRSIP